jgi:hypothetical protein
LTYFLGDLCSRALANRNHTHHSGNAHDDAEHGEKAACFVCPEGSERDLQGFD